MSTIVQTVKNRWLIKPEVNAGIANLVGYLLHRVALTIFGKSSSKMQVNESCTGCRTCERICPRNNITINNTTPVWGNDCEGCLACVQWCPVTAIDMGEDTLGRTRMHNTNVKAADLMIKTRNKPVKHEPTWTLP